MVVSGAWREADLANGSHPPATALDAARTRSLFRLIHLPKTGGTSVETLLSLGHQPHRRLSKLAWWCGALDASPSIRAAGCSSGVGRSSSPFLLPHGAGRPATPLLVVLLRHPTERVLSQYYFFRGWHTHVGLLCDRHPPRDTLCAAPEARVRCGQPQIRRNRAYRRIAKRIDGRQALVSLGDVARAQAESLSGEERLRREAAAETWRNDLPGTAAARRQAAAAAAAEAAGDGGFGTALLLPARLAALSSLVGGGPPPRDS